jgi:hypothetical protein
MPKRKSIFHRPSRVQDLSMVSLLGKGNFSQKNVGKLKKIACCWRGKKLRLHSTPWENVRAHMTATVT